MRAAVDRIENGFAILIVCDNNKVVIQLPVFFLNDVREGDIVDIIVTRVEAATGVAREKTREIIAKMDKRPIG